MGKSKKGVGIRRKDLLIYFASDKKIKSFIEELSKVETKKAYNNNIGNKEEYKVIIEQYPWFIPDENNKNRRYNFNKWLNEKISQAPNNGDIYEILKKFQGGPEDQKLNLKPIQDFIDGYIDQQEKEEIEEGKRNIKAEAEQRAAEEIEKQKRRAEQAEKEKEEDKRKHEEEIAEAEQRNKEDLERQQAESYRRELEREANRKHKADEKIKQMEEKAKNDNIFNTRLKSYVRDHYIKVPLTREELIKKVSEDPNLNANNEQIVNKYVDYILGKQLNRIITSKTKIIKTAKLFGNDSDYLSKLDPMVREAVLKYQTDMINKTITDKNNKYLLPKKYIKFEKAINNYKVNPLVLRGLYVK